jgi:hypothetical protein
MVENPTAIRFCSNRIRVAANKLRELYDLATEINDEWAALRLGDIIPGDTTQIDDKTDTNGLPVITGSDVLGVMYRLSEFKDACNANNKANLMSILKVANFD